MNEEIAQLKIIKIDVNQAVVIIEAGWTLKEVLTCDDVQVQTDYNNPTNPHHQYFPVKHAFLVLERSENEVIKELQIDRITQAKQLQEARTALDERLIHYDSAVDEIKALSYQNESMREESDKLFDDNKELRTQSCKMEEDLSLVRRAIGEERFKEILIRMRGSNQ